jgi:hypothetical protein
MVAKPELQQCVVCASRVAANLEAYWRATIASGMIRAAHFGPAGPRVNEDPPA